MREMRSWSCSTYHLTALPTLSPIPIVY